MDKWQTYPIEFKGGLISNLSPLQQGIQAPGSARILRNYEPSVEGGYGRILGYTKYDNALVPYYGAAVVQGSGQTGTTLIVANVTTSPSAGSTVTIGANTYTIASAGVIYDEITLSATLTLTSSLLSSPADGAAVVFSNTSALITGVAAWDNTVIATRGGDVYKSIGSGYTRINTPSYGTVLVNGGSQTGTSLVVDGLTGTPQIGDTFTVSGIEKTYTVTAIPTVSSGGATLTISPSLASSPADNAALTFKTSLFSAGTKTKFSKYRIGNVEKIVGVNGVAIPFIYNGTTFSRLNGVPDIVGAQHVAWFKNSLFFAKGDALVFTSPFTDNDFNVANGSGVINVGGEIKGLIVFREQLIIFCEQKIKKLVGTSIADYSLQPITENLGCVDGDTIREISSDVMFLAADGLRLLSATDRIGDFSLAAVSKPIQKELTDLIANVSSFSALVIKAKSQYRIFSYSPLVASDAAKGILGTLLIDGGISWAELRGIKVYVSDSDYFNKDELIVFGNSTGYVYRLENSNSFDGETIKASFYTPYLPINDPRVRKTFYKLFTYFDAQGSVSTSLNLKLDFDVRDSIQPELISLTNSSGDVAIYGRSTSIFGTSIFNGKLQNVLETQIIGSGFSVSLQYESDGTDPPYIFDAATIEFATHDRR